MPRKKGTPKTGGRQKGTPNKATTAVKDCIAEVIGNYMQPSTGDASRLNIYDDLAAMQPDSRVRAMTALAGYVVPKQQAMTIEEQTQLEADALTQWLETAPDDAIDAIAAKVLELQKAKTWQA